MKLVARGRRGREDGGRNTTTTTDVFLLRQHHHHHRHHRRVVKASSLSTNDSNNNNKAQHEYFNCTVVSNDPISADESYRLLTVEIDDDVATMRVMSKQLKMNKEKANGTTTGRTHTTRDSSIDGGYVKNETDFDSEWLSKYVTPGQSAQFKLLSLIHI